MNNILIIGCGHMGTALLNTWHNKTKNSFTIVDPIRYKFLNRKYKKKMNCFNNISQINHFIKFDIVILAVKPQATDSALKILKKLKFKKNVLFITIIAGKKLLFYKRYLPLNSQIIRVMPNLPASIEKGMSCIYPNKLTTKKNINKAIFLFRKVGKVLILNSEKDIDKVTAVSGSGPGYFFLFIHFLEQAAVKLGFSSKIAKDLVVQTALGSILLLIKNKKNAQELVNNIAIKGGTTEAAIKMFNKDQKFKKLIHKSVKTAFHKSIELGKK